MLALEMISVFLQKSFTVALFCHVGYFVLNVYLFYLFFVTPYYFIKKLWDSNFLIESLIVIDKLL